MKPTLFITGTDTGVGKTVVAAVLAGYFREQGLRVAAVKPICSGGRDDAQMLESALGGTRSLAEINPWYFAAPIAPLLAARAEKKKVRLAAVLTHIRKVRRACDVMIVEGAGGLLSPLGEDFNSRDLIAGLGARPVVVARNRLGAINHVLMTLEALPGRHRAQAEVILVMPPRSDAAASTNGELLGELGIRGIQTLPWLGSKWSIGAALRQAAVRKVLRTVARRAHLDGHGQASD